MGYSRDLPLQMPKSSNNCKVMSSSSSLSHMSERSSASTTCAANDYIDIRENDLHKKISNMQKTIDEMQMCINEKEAEIIRLNLCLGDEKKRNHDLKT